jgi:predicted  nucleic acid-binding Zn-ribbon protein
MGIKMADKDSPKFKIRFDDEGPFDTGGTEPPLQEKVENLRLKKLSRRINLFAVLIPCLLAIVLVFGYFDIRKRFDNIHYSGSSDVQALSKEVDSKFSSLSIRQAKVEALLNNKISAMEKTAARLEKRLDQTEKALSGVKASTPDKEALADIIAEVEKKLIPINAEVKKLSSELKKLSSDAKTLQDKSDKESAKLSTAVSGLQKEIGMLKADSASLASSRVDKKTLELTIRHEEKFFQQKLNDLEKSLSEKIEALSNQVKALEDKQKQTAAAGATPAAPQPVLAAPPPVESIKPAIPKPGKIIEQELKR